MALSGFALAGFYILAFASQSWAAIEVNMEDRVEVVLGQRAEIGCQYKMDSDPSTAVIQWFARRPGSNSDQERIFYKDSTGKILDQDSSFAGRVTVEDSLPGSVVLIVEPVMLEDEQLYICHVNSGDEGGAEGSTKLRVFSRPGVPIIEGAHTGISVHEVNPSKIASCEVKKGYPLPNITWYRNNTPLQLIDGEVGVINQVTRDSRNLFTVKSELQMKVKKEDKDASFYCESSYFMPGSTRMAESNLINITVHYPSTSVKLQKLSPKGTVKEGDTVEFRCYADGNPIPPLTFTHNDEDLDGQFLTEDQQGVVLRNVKRRDGGIYTCTALELENLDEELKDSISLTVHYLDEVVVRPEKPQVLSQGALLEASCNALSSLNTSTDWFKDGQYVTQGHTLKLPNVSVDMAGQYQCVVSAIALPEMQREGFLQVFVQSQPQITDVRQGDREDDENSVNVTCVAQGYPTPAITWSSPNVQDLDELSYTTEMSDGVISTVTVKATSALTVICQAVNQFGEDKRELSVEPIDPETTPAATTSRPAVLFETTTTSGTVQTGLFTTPGSVQTDMPFATETNQSSVAPETNVTAGPSTKSGESVTVKPPRKVQKEGSGVIIAVLIICVLLLAILGSVLYFLFKKGKIPCGRSGKQDLTKQKSNKDAIVMEMKTDKSDEAVLLQGVNGEKKAP